MDNVTNLEDVSNSEDLPENTLVDNNQEKEENVETIVEENVKTDNLIVEAEKESDKNKNTKEEIKPTTFWGKIKYFVRKNSEYFIISQIVFILFMLTCIINKAMPFGKDSILVSDTYGQIAEFFNHIFDVLQGKATLFYSNAFGGGVEIFSTIQYMHTNPFYIIVLLGGRSNILLMLTFSTLLMLMFNGIVFIWFAKRHFPKTNKVTRIILSLFYVFSAFINYNFSFVTWYIYPALILFVIDRFIYFFKTQKIISLILVLTWYVCACYSMGISTIIVLFVLMTAAVFYLKEKEERAKFLTSLCVTFVVVALASITILFPSVTSLLGSERASTFRTILTTYSNYGKTKISVLFFCPIISMLVIFYIIKCNKKDKLNKFLLFVAIILFAPVFLDTIMKMLCFSQYSGFYNRFYFMNEALMFGVALLFFEKIELKFENHKTQTMQKILIPFMITLLSIVIVILYAINIKQLGIMIKSPMNTSSALLKIFFSIFVCLLILLLTVFFFYWRKTIGTKVLKITMAFIILFSFLSSYITFTATSCEKFEYKTNVYQILEDNNIKGSVKFFTNTSRYEYNIGLENGKNLGFFSSLISQKTIDAFRGVGYSGLTVFVESITGTLLSDIMMGLEYYITYQKQNRPYLIEVAKDEKNGLYLYKNTLVTSGAFLLNSNFSYDANLSTIENFENLKNSLGIEGELFKEIEFDKTTFIDSEDEQEKLKIEYTPSKDGILYINSRASEIAGEYHINKFNCIQDIGYVTANEKFSENLFISSEVAQEFKLYFMDYEIVEKISKKLNENEVSLEYTKNGYISDFVITGKQSLYVMRPNIKGYNYILNGKNVEVEEVFGGMIKFSSEEEFNHFSIEYKYPHAKTWILFFIVSVVLISVILVLHHYTKFKAIQVLVDYAMRIVAGLIIAVVYVIGGLISICYFFI